MPDFMAIFKRETAKRPWLDHLVRAAMRFNSQRGDYYAAGITYFTVLSLFPLIMVAFAVAGFVLAGDQELLNSAKENITSKVPGDMGNQINDLIDQAIHQRNSVGAIGLLGGLYAGLGWMANLRAALTEQWDQKHEDANFFLTKLYDLLALIGLGIAFIVSMSLSAISAQGVIGERLLGLVGLDDAPGVGLALKGVTLLLAVAASWALFCWIIARLPREPVTFGSAARAALLAAVIFEVFKQIATWYLKSVVQSPAGAVFGPIIGIMVFAFFVYRIILFATAWAATATENLALAPVVPPETATITPRIEVRRSPAGAVALFGAGALAALGISRLRR